LRTSPVATYKIVVSAPQPVLPEGGVLKSLGVPFKVNGSAVVFIYALHLVAEPGVHRYVGESCDPARRLKEHLGPSSGDTEPLRDWVARELGAGHEITYKVLDVTDVANKVECEQYWIEREFAAGQPLFNVSKGGNGRTPGFASALKGRKLGPRSPEARRNMSRARKGKKIKPHSESHCRNIGLSHKGRKATPEALANMRRAALNRPPASKETRERMRRAQTGKKASPEERRKISRALKGRKATPEARRNNGLAKRRYWAEATPAQREKMLASFVRANAKKRAGARKRAERKSKGTARVLPPAKGEGSGVQGKE
jgi:hypothetical protein